MKVDDFLSGKDEEEKQQLTFSEVWDAAVNAAFRAMAEGGCLSCRYKSEQAACLHPIMTEPERLEDPYEG